MTSRTTPGASVPPHTPFAWRWREQRVGVGRTEHDEVGADGVGIDRPGPPRGDRFGDHVRALVVLGEPVDVLAERDETGRGEHAGLAHRAAESLALAAGALDHLARPGEQRADRARPSPSTGSTSPSSRRSAYARRAHARRDLCVEQARAVEVDGQAERGDRVDGLDGPRRARARHVRVLDEDRADRHLMVLREIDRELHVVERELATRVVDGVPLDRRVHRRGAVLERDDVLRAARDHCGARHAEHSQRDLVRHRARRHEDSGLLAEPRGELGLELD